MQTSIGDSFDNRTLSSMAHLHRITVDVLAGYETMLDKSEPQFRPTVLRFINLHRAHSARIGMMLIEAGLVPNESGSLMGLINKAAVSIRALFDHIDEDVLKQIHSGESHVLSAFEDALSPFTQIGRLDDPRIDEIEAMRAELTRLLDSTRPPLA